MTGNLATRLPRARKGGMSAFDALPPELRHWLHDAALPWSAPSVQRLWARAMREAGGDATAARARLDAAQAQAIARDARRVWGPGYPAAGIDAREGLRR
ncbi:DUF6525 family protein [Plastorhodobacter daqingensis]|uniref:DUF6525 family protein n=1 Tax=Plastorhodobacter daqingensis TaxID=1387281 RepID=A0ABW2UQG8_9RHOB